MTKVLNKLLLFGKLFHNVKPSSSIENKKIREKIKKEQENQIIVQPKSACSMERNNLKVMNLIKFSPCSDHIIEPRENPREIQSSLLNTESSTTS